MKINETYEIHGTRGGLTVCSLGLVMLASSACSNPASTDEGGEAWRFIVKYHADFEEDRRAALHDELGGQRLSRNEALDFEEVQAQGGSLDEVMTSYGGSEGVAYVEELVEYQVAFTPNDPYYDSSQYGATLISLDSAWDLTLGASDVIVAVVDTGVQDDHEDLVGQVVSGYDFIDDDSDASDEQGHGTHVAGTVAALIDNSVGIAGVAPSTTVMAVRVLDENGSGTSAGVAHGISYAVDHGASVINLSMSTSSSSSVVEEAVDYAWSKGVVVVAAAGNGGDDTPMHPASVDHAIAVAATDSNDEKASFSSYGRWVDVAAPGVSIISTEIGGDYETESGTSMAAAHVSGVAALLASQGLDNTEIRAAVEGGADEVTGTDELWVHGRVNALQSLSFE